MGISSSEKNNRFWFPLDNAAKIFPAIVSNEVPVVFRLTAVLKEPVKIKLLQKTMLLVEKRFPYYKVQLKNGFFWYYMEYIPGNFPVNMDDNVLCRKFSSKENLLRILVKENRISIEFSHIITDGGGGLEFFKTILIEYSKACGLTVPNDFPYIKPDSPINEEEYEDAYNRYFNEDIPPMVKRSKAFHLPFTLNPSPRFKQSTLIFSLEEIKKVANAKQANITVYLISAYLFVLQEIFDALPSSNKFKKNKKIRIQVPVNLRNIYPTKTMRNFSLFVMPEIDLRLGHYSFDEILKTVFHQMQLQTDEKLINKNISRNVGEEKKTYVRGIPLYLKSAILRMKSNSLGISQYSGVISNLGKVNLPPEIGKMVDHFVFMPSPPSKLLKQNCGIIGYGNKLVLSIGNITKSQEFEKKLRRFLESQGINIETDTK